MFDIFTKHPESVCLTYIQHMWFSLGLSWTFGKASISAFVHAFIPSLFKKSSSLYVDYVSKKMLEIGCRKEPLKINLNGISDSEKDNNKTPIEEISTPI
jgi:hypothetical protein